MQLHEFLKEQHMTSVYILVNYSSIYRYMPLHKDMHAIRMPHEFHWLAIALQDAGSLASRRSWLIHLALPHLAHHTVVLWEVKCTGFLLPLLLNAILQWFADVLKQAGSPDCLFCVAQPTFQPFQNKLWLSQKHFLQFLFWRDSSRRLFLVYLFLHLRMA